MSRFFENVAAYPTAKLPSRSTKSSAGYDLFAAETIICEPGVNTLIPIGCKVKCPKWQFLGIYLRSSTLRKFGLIQPSIGIVDSDYYDTDNTIYISVYNISPNAVTISKDTSIAQGIFQDFYKTKDDHSADVRTGGFGSTDISK